MTPTQRQQALELFGDDVVMASGWAGFVESMQHIAANYPERELSRSQANALRMLYQNTPAETRQ